MDDTRSLGSLHTLHKCPSAALVSTCSEERLEVEQFVCRLDKTSYARLLKTHILQEHLTLLVILQLGDISLGSSSYDKHLGILIGNSRLHSLGVSIARYGRGLIHVADIQYRLIGQKVKVRNQFTLLLIGLHSTCRATLLQRLLELHEQIVLALGILVTRYGLLLALADIILYGLQILELQLCINNTLVAHGVHRTINVSNITILEATQNVDNSIRITNISQELISKTLTLRCALHQAGNINNLNCCGDNLLRVIYLGQLNQTLIGHGDNTHVGLDCTEREVCSLRLCI